MFRQTWDTKTHSKQKETERDCCCLLGELHPETFTVIQDFNNISVTNITGEADNIDHTAQFVRPQTEGQ